MLKKRMKLMADRDARAARRLALIEQSIVALSDDDLLDLADIFRGDATTPLGESATAEMTRRNISLA